MEFFLWAILLAVATHFLNKTDQARRIALLGRYLSQYQIEKMMERLTEGYQRALGESDPLRRGQIWANLITTEQELSRQFGRFVADFAQVDEPQARLSRLPFALPWATRLLPQACADMRKLLAIHAHGLARAAEPVADDAPVGAWRDRAYTLLAEMLLMQHSCHWFCKSKAVASARLVVRHHTSHAQVLDAVTRETRQAYASLIGQA